VDKKDSKASDSNYRGVYCILVTLKKQHLPFFI